MQQQKGQIQALQHDKEDLQRQLQRCTPKEFDRLHFELLGAKRKAAELPLVQEQLQRQKQLWSEAEQRLAELQAAAARSQEEAAAKQASLSVQLSTARDELAAIRKEQKQLQQQLVNAQDAVRVCAAVTSLLNHQQLSTSTHVAGKIRMVTVEIYWLGQHALQSTCRTRPVLRFEHLPVRLLVQPHAQPLSHYCFCVCRSRRPWLTAPSRLYLS